jgi:polyhydroxyalkanoate synthesis regulator phasin
MAENTARLLSLDEVRARVTQLREQGERIVGQLRKDARALVVEGKVVEEARRLRTEARSRAEDAIKDLDTRRAKAIETVLEQLARLTDLAVKRFRLATHDEVADLGRRIADLEQQLAELRKTQAPKEEQAA